MVSLGTGPAYPGGVVTKQYQILLSLFILAGCAMEPATPSDTSPDDDKYIAEPSDDRSGDLGLACDTAVGECHLVEDTRVAAAFAAPILFGLTALELVAIAATAVALGYVSYQAVNDIDDAWSILRMLSPGQLWNAFVEAHWSSGVGAGHVFAWGDLGSTASGLVGSTRSSQCQDALTGFAATMNRNGNPLDEVVEDLIDAPCGDIRSQVEDLLCDLFSRLDGISHSGSGVVARALSALRAVC